ncbi:hypothetical protein [Streptomyces wedmorensis]
MTERTQLTQQDEALRQTLLTEHTRDGLRFIADKLTHIKPGNLMTEDQRLAIALTAAHTIRKNYPGQDIDELEIHLLRRMSYTDGKTVTRGEYALWLHKTSWSA